MDITGTITARVVTDSRPRSREMRDAVRFLSEHGRPRVQLGELLDEAVSAWLAQAKANITAESTSLVGAGFASRADPRGR